MQGNSSASSELTALQRLAAAGSEPLLAVGRALGAHLVHSLGSTTSVAITGGLGLIRLGLGQLPILYFGTTVIFQHSDFRHNGTCVVMIGMYWDPTSCRRILFDTATIVLKKQPKSGLC